MNESNIPESDGIRYEFYFADGHKESIVIQLKKPELSLVVNPSHKGEEWTKLDNYKCPNCPLDSATTPHCPIAFNLTDLVKVFAKYKSHEEVDVRILTTSREYRQTVSLAEGLSSLLGMYMVTSGCPVMDHLRPMVYTHLPFATADETMYRVISMYLTAQHFKKEKGMDVTKGLDGLVEIYDEIRKVNVNFSKRLANVTSKDANISALVNLDGYALLTSASILDDGLEEIESLFKAYLK